MKARARLLVVGQGTGALSGLEGSCLRWAARLQSRLMQEEKVEKRFLVCHSRSSCWAKSNGEERSSQHLLCSKALRITLADTEMARYQQHSAMCFFMCECTPTWR